MLNIGKQSIIKKSKKDDFSDSNSEIFNMLSEYGFIANKENPPTKESALKLCEASGLIVNALQIDPKIIGNGSIVSQSEVITANLDTSNNVVNFNINENINSASLSIIWIGASSRFGLIRDMEPALRLMANHKIDEGNTRDLLSKKWKFVEELLFESMSQIEHLCSTSPSNVLKQKDIDAIKKTFNYITGSEDCPLPVTNAEASSAIARMSREIVDISGVNLPEETLSHVFSLMCLRNDVVNTIQEFNANYEKEFHVPYKYFERMSILSRVDKNDIMSVAPGFAIAAYVGRANGIKAESHSTDANLFPTEDEMNEMNDAIKEFCSVINGEVKPKAMRRMK